MKLKILILIVILFSSGCASKDIENPENIKNTVNTVEDDKVSLISTKSNYNLNEETIKFIIRNDSNEILYTHIAPALEFKKDDNWILLAMNKNAGFCGNKDSIQDYRTMTLNLNWYDNLQAGDYRISFNIYSESFNQEKLFSVSTEFSLK